MSLDDIGIILCPFCSKILFLAPQECSVDKVIPINCYCHNILITNCIKSDFYQLSRFIFDVANIFHFDIKDDYVTLDYSPEIGTDCHGIEISSKFPHILPAKFLKTKNGDVFESYESLDKYATFPFHYALVVKYIEKQLSEQVFNGEVLPRVNHPLECAFNMLANGFQNQEDKENDDI